MTVKCQYPSSSKSSPSNQKTRQTNRGLSAKSPMQERKGNYFWQVPLKKKAHYLTFRAGTGAAPLIEKFCINIFAFPPRSETLLLHSRTTVCSSETATATTKNKKNFCLSSRVIAACEMACIPLFNKWVCKINTCFQFSDYLIGMYYHYGFLIFWQEWKMARDIHCCILI